jgi:hypothetical protein
VFKEKEKKNSLQIEEIINKKVSPLRLRNKSELKSSSSIAELNRAMRSIRLFRANSARFSNCEINLLSLRLRETNWETTSTTLSKRQRPTYLFNHSE